jgi:hypothetical protein
MSYRRHAAHATAGMPSCVETGDQIDQESRSAGHGVAASMTAMDITIHSTFAGNLIRINELR